MIARSLRFVVAASRFCANYFRLRELSYKPLGVESRTLAYEGGIAAKVGCKHAWKAVH